MQLEVLKTAVPALNAYFFSIGYFMIASVGQACEHALQPSLQKPSVEIMTGDQSARNPCSSPAGFKMPVGQAFMHSAQRMQLERKSCSSRDIGGRVNFFTDFGSPAERLIAGAVTSAIAPVARSCLRSSCTGNCEWVTAGIGFFSVKKF